MHATSIHAGSHAKASGANATGSPRTPNLLLYPLLHFGLINVFPIFAVFVVFLSFFEVARRLVHLISDLGLVLNHDVIQVRIEVMLTHRLTRHSLSIVLEYLFIRSGSLVMVGVDRDLLILLSGCRGAGGAPVYFARCWGEWAGVGGRRRTWWLHSGRAFDFGRALVSHLWGAGVIWAAPGVIWLFVLGLPGVSEGYFVYGGRGLFCVWSPALSWGPPL